MHPLLVWIRYFVVFIHDLLNLSHYFSWELSLLVAYDGASKEPSFSRWKLYLKYNRNLNQNTLSPCVFWMWVTCKVGEIIILFKNNGFPLFWGWFLLLFVSSLLLFILFLVRIILDLIKLTKSYPHNNCGHGPVAGSPTNKCTTWVWIGDVRQQWCAMYQRLDEISP